MRRALVSLPDGVWKIIDEELRGKIGEADSEVIRNIVIAYLSEKGYFVEKGKGSVNQFKEEIDMHDKMLATLVELLEEKGSLRYSEWENKIKKKIMESTSKPIVD